MGQGRVIIDALVYDDAAVTNDPLQNYWKYRTEQILSGLTTVNSGLLRLPPSAITAISPPSPATPAGWIILYTDQILDIVTTSISTGFPGGIPAVPAPWNQNSALGQWVVPLNPGLVKDGVYLYKGIITGLRIGVPGSTAANVAFYTGA